MGDDGVGDGLVGVGEDSVAAAAAASSAAEEAAAQMQQNCHGQAYSKLVRKLKGKTIFDASKMHRLQSTQVTISGCSIC